jgi:serine/threonine protein kinase
MYEISTFGLGLRQIKSDLSDLSGNLPTWKDIIPINESVPGLSDYFLLDRAVEDFEGNKWLPAFQWDSLMASGTYGKIYKGFRSVYKLDHTETDENQNYKLETSNQSIVLKEIVIRKKNIKEITKEIESVLYEATIHALVVQLFRNLKWSFAVPQLYEVFLKGSRSSQSIYDVRKIVLSMEYIQGITLFDFFKQRLIINNQTKNDKIFLRILAEIALLTSQIESHLRMNHRDMKVNNILIRNKNEDWIGVFGEFYPALNSFDDFPYNIVLIDYGFACISCGEGMDLPLVEAGNWFRSSDVCFKEGRDMVQFIFCLECYFPAECYFTENLQKLVKKWLTVNSSMGPVCLSYGLTEEGFPQKKSANPPIFNKGIYEFLRRTEVNPNHCSPKIILEDIKLFIDSS